MRMIHRLVAIVAASLLSCAPVAAQKISALPAASALGGTEKLAGIQGGGCAAQTAPCATVAITAAQIATLANATAQPLDSDLTAIAALATTTYGRSLLTQADASATRSTIGLGSISTQGAGAVAITGGTITGITDLAVADGGTGASTAANARTNLGLAIGSNVQAWNAQLDALAALSGQTFGRSLLTTASAQAASVSIAAPWTVAQSGAPVSLTGSTTKTTLATIAIPAGTIGPNGSVEIDVIFTGTSSANNKSLSIDFGGTTLWGAVVTTSPAIRATASIFNTNSASAQTALSTLSGTGAGGLGTVLTSTINTGSAVNITLTGTLANASETITLLHYLVRVTYGA